MKEHSMPGVPVKGRPWRPTPQLLAGICAALLATGCAVVPAYQRQHLAHPTMRLEPEPLEAMARDKLHRSREAAGGGEGRSAGGGCGCSN